MTVRDTVTQEPSFVSTAVPRQSETEHEHLVERRAADLRWRSGVRELLVVAMLYAGYSVGRLLADDDLAAASDRAAEILRVEHLVGLDLEWAWSTWLASHHVLAVAASYWYSVGHYTVTPAVLLWLWWARSTAYAKERWTLVLASVIGLVVYVAVPVAPPRLMGYVDVLATTATAGWWTEHASAPAGLGHLTNELAAMPSLHVGWAVWAGLVVWRLAHRPVVRLLAVAHPVVTSVVVVATANHWLLDVVAGAMLVLVVDVAVSAWHDRRVRSVGRHDAATSTIGGSGEHRGSLRC